jgi:hypothetical protein
MGQKIDDLIEQAVSIAKVSKEEVLASPWYTENISVFNDISAMTASSDANPKKQENEPSTPAKPKVFTDGTSPGEERDGIPLAPLNNPSSEGDSNPPTNSTGAPVLKEAISEAGVVMPEIPTRVVRTSNSITVSFTDVKHPNLKISTLPDFWTVHPLKADREQHTLLRYNPPFKATITDQLSEVEAVFSIASDMIKSFVGLLIAPPNRKITTSMELKEILGLGFDPIGADSENFSLVEKVFPDEKNQVRTMLMSLAGRTKLDVNRDEYTTFMPAIFHRAFQLGHNHALARLQPGYPRRQYLKVFDTPFSYLAPPIPGIPAFQKEMSFPHMGAMYALLGDNPQMRAGYNDRVLAPLMDKVLSYRGEIQRGSFNTIAVNLGLGVNQVEASTNIAGAISTRAGEDFIRAAVLSYFTTGLRVAFVPDPQVFDLGILIDCIVLHLYPSECFTSETITATNNYLFQWFLVPILVATNRGVTRPAVNVEDIRRHQVDFLEANRPLLTSASVVKDFFVYLGAWGNSPGLTMWAADSDVAPYVSREVLGFSMWREYTDEYIVHDQFNEFERFVELVSTNVDSRAMKGTPIRLEPHGKVRTSAMSVLSVFLGRIVANRDSWEKLIHDVNSLGRAMSYADLVEQDLERAFPEQFTTQLTMRTGSILSSALIPITVSSVVDFTIANVSRSIALYGNTLLDMLQLSRKFFIEADFIDGRKRGRFYKKSEVYRRAAESVSKFISGPIISLMQDNIVGPKFLETLKIPTYMPMFSIQPLFEEYVDIILANPYMFGFTRTICFQTWPKLDNPQYGEKLSFNPGARVTVTRSQYDIWCEQRQIRAKIDEWRRTNSAVTFEIFANLSPTQFEMSHVSEVPIPLEYSDSKRVITHELKRYVVIPKFLHSDQVLTFDWKRPQFFVENAPTDYFPPDELTNMARRVITYRYAPEYEDGDYYTIARTES